MKWYLRDFIAIISWCSAPRYASRIFSFLSAVLLTKRNNLLKVTQPLNITILTQPFLRDKIPWCHSNEHHFSSLFNYPNSISYIFIHFEGWRVQCWQSRCQSTYVHSKNSIPHNTIKQDGSDTKSDFYGIIFHMSSFKR